MKTVLCYGASNVWGFIPGSWSMATGLSRRYTPDERWTGILQKELGSDYFIIEEGLNGRTTAFDDIVSGKLYRNGLKQIPICLESHYPIDLVIVMLGSNDTKIQFGLSAKEISEGLRQLTRAITKSDKGINGKPPKVLIIAPQQIEPVAELSELIDKNSILHSRELAKYYQLIAIEEGCEFLDAGKIVVSSPVDGVHLDKSQLILLGHAVALKVQQLFL